MIKVGILGATGAVGQRFVQLLAKHPWFELTALCASERSATKRYRDAVNWRLDVPFPESIGDLTVRRTDPEELKDVSLVFSALPADMATKVEVDCAKAGIGVCSNASSHRMENHIPLVIPEVNSEHLALIDAQRKDGWDGFIVTNPNCSTIVLSTSLTPIQPLGFSDVKVATMQAISGAGFQGVAAMSIYDNVIPYIGEEEEKMERETLKILGTLNGDSVTDAPVTVSASCHRVPVIDGHTMAVWVNTRASPDEVKDAFRNYVPKIRDLPSLPKSSIDLFMENDRPQPRLDRNRGDGMTVSVGRVRKGIRYVTMGHNTIRGAAGASVLNAELIVQRKYL